RLQYLAALSSAVAAHPGVLQRSVISGDIIDGHPLLIRDPRQVARGHLAFAGASGLPGGTACSATGDTATILARKVVRTYDARNRIDTLTFPDNNGNQAWDYTPDGLPESITTYNDG